MAVWPYNTQQWQRLRRLKLATDPLCEYCPTDTVTPATEVDHVLAIEQGGDPWDWDNLKSACKPCHSRKTQHIDIMGKDRVPVKGCDANGLPLDPADPWNAKNLSELRPADRWGIKTQS